MAMARGGPFSDVALYVSTSLRNPRRTSRSATEKSRPKLIASTPLTPSGAIKTTRNASACGSAAAPPAPPAPPAVNSRPYPAATSAIVAGGAARHASATAGCRRPDSTNGRTTSSHRPVNAPASTPAITKNGATTGCSGPSDRKYARHRTATEA